jgi:hypothetical protein
MRLDLGDGSIMRQALDDSWMAAFGGVQVRLIQFKVLSAWGTPLPVSPKDTVLKELACRLRKPAVLKQLRVKMPF